jgi:hypothetical protein
MGMRIPSAVSVVCRNTCCMWAVPNQPLDPVAIWASPKNAIEIGGRPWQHATNEYLGIMIAYVKSILFCFVTGLFEIWGTSIPGRFMSTSLLVNCPTACHMHSTMSQAVETGEAPTNIQMLCLGGLMIQEHTIFLLRQD